MKYRKHVRDAGLFDYQERVEKLKQRETALDKLNETVDWEFFRQPLEARMNYSDQSRGGRPPFDPVFMFKVVVLQKYYGLSEEDTEFQILDRFSFQRFLGLDVSSAVPDKNTVWTFKERLGKDGVKELFAAFEAALYDLGLTASPGKIVDATIVETKRTHQKADGEPERLEPGPRWTKKRQKSYFGFKNHIKVNAESKLIESYEATPADIHDSVKIVGLADAERDGSIHADSAYCGREDDLLEKEIEPHFNRRAYRNRPLTDADKAHNKILSKTRARVEHVFGFQANSMRGRRLRTLDWKRGCFQIGMGNLVYNLFRAAQLGASVG
jgi:IS5 family transposase